MAFYSEEVIEEIAARNDLVDVISSYVKLEKKGRDYSGLCPFHNEKTPSFKVSSQKQLYHCFGCHESGNAFTFLMKYDNLTFVEAVEELARRCGYELPKQEQDAGQKAAANKRAVLMELHKDAAAFYYKLLRSKEGAFAYTYFSHRGLTKETLQNFGLGYSGRRPNQLYEYLKEKGYTDDVLKQSGLVLFDEKRGGRDRFWNRAMFPIMDSNRRVIAFGGRVMGDGQPKYLNSPETDIFDKSKTLYGLHLARHTRREQLILCEGYMDVIALHQAGFDNAIATLGTAMTSRHAQMLKRYKKPVFLCYDSDAAGQQAIVRSFRILQEMDISCRVIELSPYKDPDEFIQNKGKDAFEERVKEADNAFIHTMMYERGQYDIFDPDGLTNFQRHLATSLLMFEEDDKRLSYIKISAQTFDLSFDHLQKLVNEVGAGIGRRPQIRRTRSVPEKKQEGNQTGSYQRQKVLLQYLQYPPLFFAISSLIRPEDFDEGLLQEAAGYIYTQMEQGKAVKEEGITAQFTQAQDQTEISSIFFADEENHIGREHLSQVIKEAAVKVKMSSVERAKAAIDPSDTKGWQDMKTKGQQQIEQIKALDFAEIMKKEI